MANLPQMVSARAIQRDYRKLFDRVKRTKKPLIVMKNNKPDVAIVDLSMLGDLEVKQNDTSRSKSAYGMLPRLNITLKDFRKMRSDTSNSWKKEWST
jgi:prevent-host-death family protein